MSPARGDDANSTPRSRTRPGVPGARRRRPAAAAVSPTHGRREHRKRATRRELLEAGRKLFADQGLYDSRIEDLSRQAGIAKGTLYGYFEGKDELMAAVVSAGFDELLGAVHRAAHGARSYFARLEAVARAHFDFYDANPDLLRIFHQVRGLLKYGREESQVLRPVLTAYLRGLAQALALPVAGQRRPSRHPLDSAGALFGAVSGMCSARASLPAVLPGAPDAGPAARAVAALVLELEGRATG